VAALASVELVEAAPEGAIGLEIGLLALPGAAADRDAGAGRGARLKQELDTVESRLADANFQSRAPAAVVEMEKKRAAELRAAIERLQG
jgi:valyl-tRNA synthetase